MYPPVQRVWRSRGLLAIIVMLAAVGCSSMVEETPTPELSPTPQTTPSPTPVPLVCPLDPAIVAGDQFFTLQHDGMERSYLLHIPEKVDLSVAGPLVVNMHGAGSTNWQQVLFSDMSTSADALGFIVVYPQGYGNTWNAGTCCGQAVRDDIDDVGFIRALVADVSAKVCVDASRVYATGMSNGGYMSHRLGCEAADLFAAIAPVAGEIGIPSCTPSRPIPVIAYHGTEDPLVPYQNGADSVQTWADLNGCQGEPVHTVFGNSYCDVYESCNAGARTGLCTLDPEGHCWPGGSESLCLPPIAPYNDDIHANEHMWAFFATLMARP